nr:N-acetylmuramoyl-L-alanine amidase [Modestobacter versicolor]
MTGTVLTLPVYAAPVPAPHPVETSIDEVELGSVVEPEGDAVVATDGVVQPDGVEESQAAGSAAPGTSQPATESAPADPSAAPSTAPTGDEPAGTSTPAETSSPASSAPASSGPASDEDVPTSGEELPGVPALTVSREDTDPFSAVGVTWRDDPSITDVQVQVRTQDEDGDWGEWGTLEADDIEQTESPKTEDLDVRGGTAPYWTGPARGIEVIVQGAGGAVPEDVSVALLDPGTSKADALPATGAKDEAHAGTSMPDVVSRAQWGADESIRTWGPEYAPTIKAATLHHTADGNGYTAAQVPAMMRSIFAYHSQTRGWGDIGYNVIVDKYGRIFEGRYGGLSSTVIGAHAGGFNTGTFGVSMLGNYAEVDTPQAMLDSVAAIIAWKLSLYGVDPKGTTQLTSGGGGTSKYGAGAVVTLPTVFAHRDVGSTTCPGQYAYNRMGQLRDMVGSRMAGSVGGSPVGNTEKLSISGSTVTVGGWTFDPDYPAGSIDVGMLVDGVTAAHFTASRTRADVAAAYPAAGQAHGFEGTFTLAKGVHNVCAVAVNAAPTGLNTWMRCQTMTSTPPPVPSTIPFGNVEAVSVAGRTLSARGWTIDPDAQTSALDVHVYVNDGWGGALLANGSRPDVAAVHPAAGPAHGFTWSTAVSAPGPYTVCIFAINKNAGASNPKLGCQTVTVPGTSWNPQGHADSATASGRSVSVSGWAVDLDTPTTPLAVHVYVDGGYAGQVTADRPRADVGALFPGTGTAHGFSGALDLAPGEHTICAYAINTGHGETNPSLGCHPVTVAAASWNPVGSLDDVIGSGGVIEVRGWVWDPDRAKAPSDVHLYVDGRWSEAMTAAGDRPDVAGAFPKAGAAHGYAASVSVPPGQHQVCAYGINSGHGTTNPLLGCRTVTG